MWRNLTKIQISQKDASTLKSRSLKVLGHSKIHNISKNWEGIFQSDIKVARGQCVWQLLKIMKIWFPSVIFLWILDWPCLKTPLDRHISTMSWHSKDLQSCLTFIRTFEYFSMYWNIFKVVGKSVVLETWLNWKENKTPSGLDTKITEFLEAFNELLYLASIFPCERY